MIEVEGLAKKLCRDFHRAGWHCLARIGRSALGLSPSTATLGRGQFWAIQDVSFTVARGEALALVGQNGSGKSTLLRLVAGLMTPDFGRVRVDGTLAPIISLSAAMQRMLSARENAELNLALLGVPRDEVAERARVALAFAEVEHAADSPLRYFSSGMAARLGIACAVQSDADVLLLDEVMAVGDAAFKRKSQRCLQDLLARGKTMLMVSHSPGLLLETCSRAVALHEGRLVDAGGTREVLDRYHERGRVRRLEGATRQDSGAAYAELEAFLLAPVTAEGPLGLRVKLEVLRALQDVRVRVGLCEHDRTRPLMAMETTVAAMAPGTNRLDLELEAHGLAPGEYAVEVSLGLGGDLGESRRVALSVRGDTQNSGTISAPPHRWKLTNSEGNIGYLAKSRSPGLSD